MSEELTTSGMIESFMIKVGTNQQTGKQWKKGIFKINGLTYSTFDERIYNVFKEGQNVEIYFEKNGMYNNIKEMKLLSGNAQAFTPKNNSFNALQISNNSVLSDKRQVWIVRQNCNERSIEFFELMNKTQPEKLKALLENTSLQELVDTQARHFENEVFK